MKQNINSVNIFLGKPGTTRFVFCTLLLMFCLPFVSRAQDTGSITGTVRDVSGSVVPGADVQVSSAAIGLTRAIATNGDGDYLAGALPAGTYELSVTAKGFKSFTARGIILQVAEKKRVDVALQVGEISEKVIVEGASVAQVETQSSDLSGVVTGKEISQLELNGRSFVQLVALVPGVSNQTGQDFGGVGLNQNISFSVNGGRVEYNNWQVDGGNAMDTGSNGTLNVFPSVDAIGEFRVLTSNYGAQYGRNGSGTVEVVTKSGTKDFHGDAYEYLRNEMFNANDFFDNAAGNSRPAYKKHDFGYTIGGPVYIPNHYNSSKEKTFFFWSQEWHRERNPFGFNQQVPSNAERTGSFNDLCPASGNFFRSDPNGTNGQPIALPGPVNPECPATGQGPVFTAPDGTQAQSFVPFAGNKVPVDPNAQVLLNALISPDSIDSGGNSFFVKSIVEPLTWRQELVRIDHNFSSKLRLMGRYIHDTNASVDPTVSFVGNPFPTIQTQVGTPGTSFVVHLTATLSPSLLNEFVASYTTDKLILVNTGPFLVPSGFSMKSIFNTGSGGNNLAQLPAVSLASGNAYGGGFTINPGFMPWINSNPVYDYRDTITKIIRSHNLTFGGEFVAAQKNEPSAPTSVGLGGVLTFDEASPVSNGNSFADFLAGNIASYSQTSSIVKYYYRYKLFEPYFQDDWRVTKRLTLNLGLRVSLFGTNRDRTRTSFNFEPSVYNASAGKAPTIQSDGSLAPGIGNPFLGFVQCGGSGGSGSVPGPILTAFPASTVAGTSLPGCVKGHLFNPAPRIGFAWDPHGDGKMAIRGGYGIFFEYGNGNEANAESLEGTPPRVLTSSQPLISNGPNSTTTSPCTSPNTGYECIGGAGILFPLAVNNEPPANIQTVAQWPYVQQWHLDVQRELPSHFLATVSYVGSKGTHLTDARDLNQLHSIASQGIQNPYAAGQAMSNSDCNNFTINPATGFPTAATLGNGTTVPTGAVPNLWSACGNDADPFRPFVGLNTLELLETQANSHYHALQATVRRAFGGLELNMAYTYSHSIDDSSDRADATFVDSFNLNANRASSNFDERHILNISYVYDLPFFNKSSGLKKTLLGGWQLSGITSSQSGVPINITNTVFGDNAGVGNGVGTGSRPDLSGNPHAAPCATSSAPGPLLFNPCAFAAPQGLTFGNVGRNTLNRPYHTNFNMGLFKSFPIKESTSVEFRWETYNTFNHTQFNHVRRTFGSSDFLTATDTHDPRIMQFALKFIF